MLKTPLKAAILLALAMAIVPTAAFAESNFSTGTGSLTATARLDFQIVAPKVLYLQVGDGGPTFTPSAVINLLTFTVPAANIGNGTAVAGSATSGNLGNGAVTAKVVSNGGDVTLTSTTLGALTANAGADSISFSEIGVAATTLNSSVALPSPTFVTGGVSPAVNLVAVNKIVNRDARWTFSYLNNNVVPAGTYGGVNTQNGRVTYTAVTP